MIVRNILNKKKTLVDSYLREKVRRPFQKLFFRIDRKTLINSFRRVGLKEGATVCVHSSLGRIGFVVGGPNEVIDALIETVGPNGCVMMPSFPLTSSMAEFIESEQIFDVKNSPSTSGIVTEVFRHRPGVYRSMHPTNSVAAWGQGAKQIIQDHEKSTTPFGHDTPYGRLATLDDGYVLMIETHVKSLLHHLQERVHFPTFFLEKKRDAYYIDWQGAKNKVQTKVMRPRVLYFVAIPSSKGSEPDWAMIQDFALMFPKRREREVRQLGYKFKGYEKLWDRRAELEKSGVLKTTRVGRGEIGLLHIKQFLNILEPELRQLIDEFHPFYKPENIAKMHLPLIG
jgi:aminoglycoside N3'-acetyltransferase